MRYPQIGDEVRAKNETGLHTVTSVDKRGLHTLFTLSDDRTFFIEQIVTRYQKYVKTYVIQQHYGSGWEDVTSEETRSEGIQRRKEYRDNTNYPTRMIERYERNDLYQGEN